MKVFAIALWVFVQAVSAKPDLSGTWEADLAASQTGQMAYSRMALALTHADPKITIRAEVAGDFGTFASELACATDGSPCTGKDATGSTTWDGATLVVQRVSSVQGMSVKVTERLSLSPDKQTLTSERHVAADAGETTQKIVYRRK